MSIIISFHCLLYEGKLIYFYFIYLFYSDLRCPDDYSLKGSTTAYTKFIKNFPDFVYNYIHVLYRIEIKYKFLFKVQQRHC